MVPRLSRLLSLRKAPAHTKGYAAEVLAFLYLLAKGYTPAPRPRHMPVQVDLLMRRAHTLALVEVKYRPNVTKGHLALHPAQKARLHRQLTALTPLYPEYTLRIDLLIVFPTWPYIQHIPGLDLPAHPAYPRAH